MTSQDYYQHFLAINQHFNPSNTYDYMKYNGVVRCGDVSKRKDRFALAHFANKDTLEQFIARVVSYNLYDGKSPWSAIELKKPHAREYFNKWTAINKNISEIVKKDIKHVDNLSRYVMIREDVFLPDVLTDVLAGRISQQTFMCLNKVLDLTGNIYEEHYDDNTLYKNTVHLLVKAQPFLKIDNNTITQIQERM